MGKLFLIFDGFDEMGAQVDRQTMINNFWELARAVVAGSKVMLTCRILQARILQLRTSNLPI